METRRALRRGMRAIGLLWAMSLATVTGVAAPRSATHATPGSRIDFNRDIRPILSANCFACHGSDPAARQANLRLDTREDATAVRGSVRAIEPGKPTRSALVARINNPSAALQMPPPASEHHLSPGQKKLLAQWIREGAPYAEHWAFARLIRPQPPRTHNRTWSRSPIDAFVLARLEAAGLSPSPEADRYTLIRRLALDLTGLPPDPSEVRAFWADHSPNAYERLVDRMLASPRYGEHWARMWLDLARYADTQGYEKDQQRTIWRYRDWVVDAFNADMPYDRFTIAQLAGDLLANPTPAQLVATAFHRNTMTNTEGGVDAEEFRVAAVKDRVDTTVQVWMGLTMGCAKCHSHKYDPITQEDYYRFYALFNQTLDSNRGDEYPTAAAPTEEQQERLKASDERLKTLREAFLKDVPGLRDAQRAWEHTLAASDLWQPLALVRGVAQGGASFRARADGALVVAGPHPQQDTYTITYRMPPTKIRAVRFEALKDPALPNGGPGRGETDQNAVTSQFTVERADASGARTMVTLTNPRADFEQSGFPVAAVLTGKAGTGWAWAPQNSQPHVAIFDLQTALSAADGALIITIKQNYAGYQHGCFRISVSGEDPLLLKPELRTLAEIAAIPEARRTRDEQAQLDAAYRQTHEPTAAIYRDIAALERERAPLLADISRVPVMQDLPPDMQRVTHLQRRGNFLDPGAVVTPSVPAAFGPVPAGAPLNRLGAAQWLVSRDNMLTPRVAVNRVWARLFGTGLVETEEDFGTQGTPPTHPELLDWLAVSFRDDLGWSMKRLCKTIVMSATYRQASVASPAGLKADPRNLLLSRGPRVRLAAEVIRDQALAVSGLLSPKMHGPPVMPPQPDGLWRTVYSGLKWQTSVGEDRYRRALYTFWRRSSPYPSMTTFDAGSGEYCIVRRVRTNTPLQALVTLNDPAFVEAAGALGTLMVRYPVPDVRARISYGLRRMLVRPPTPAELDRLLRLYHGALAAYRSKPDSGKALLAAANTTAIPNRDAAEQAAYITVANVLLNLDEALTKP